MGRDDERLYIVSDFVDDGWTHGEGAGVVLSLETLFRQGLEQARPGGLEPPTPGSEDQCSIQLSYGRVVFGVGVL